MTVGSERPAIISVRMASTLLALLLLLLSGCTSSNGPATPTRTQSSLATSPHAPAGHGQRIAQFAPTAMAFWTTQRGLIVGSAGKRGAVLRTVDGGNTWSSVSAAPRVSMVASLRLTSWDGQGRGCRSPAPSQHWRSARTEDNAGASTVLRLRSSPLRSSRPRSASALGGTANLTTKVCGRSSARRTVARRGPNSVPIRARPMALRRSSQPPFRASRSRLPSAGWHCALGARTSKTAKPGSASSVRGTEAGRGGRSPHGGSPAKGTRHKFN
jgi:hypothetical protein